VIQLAVSLAALCGKGSALPLRHSSHQCGFAAAQCGKATPFRCLSLLLFEAAPQKEAQPPVNFSNAAVRQSLTALCGGRAADVDGVIQLAVSLTALYGGSTALVD